VALLTYETINLTAAWLRIILDAKDDLLLALTLPSGTETGVFDAHVYTDESLDTILLTSAPVPVGQVITMAYTATQNAALVPPGKARFLGHWDLGRTSAGARRTILKGDYIVSAGFEPS
jgi:hypothetical protein